MDYTTIIMRRKEWEGRMEREKREGKGEIPIPTKVYHGKY